MKFKVIFLLSLLLPISSCQDLPKVSKIEEQRYQDRLNNSGPNWTAWYPRPSWYLSSYTEKSELGLDNRIVNIIGQCSGGINLSSSDIRNTAQRIGKKAKKGNLTFNETERSIVGIDFDGNQITSDTVSLYKEFTICVTNSINAKNLACESSCKISRRADANNVLRKYDVCMNDRLKGCQRECVFEYGYSSNDCRNSLCRIENNIQHFQNKCSHISSRIRSLENDYEYCISSC